MNDENTVSLKVYLMEGKTNIEVRRFEVDQGVITNYDYVRERLQMAIPSLRDKIFRLLWQDSEGDEVTISSDEELVIALSELGKASVCKFIVRLRLQGNNNTDTDDDPDTYININIPSMHSMFAQTTSNLNNTCPIFTQMQGEVNCSNCKQPISDVRYKCLECADYCQCPDCEQKKVHPDHVMLRINKNFTLHSLIPKCMQIFKNHFIRGAGKCTGMSSFFRDRMSQCPAMNKDTCHGGEKDKSKCSYKEEKGRHHHRRFRKHHGHCSDKGQQQKSSSENEEPMQTECPFSEDLLGNLGNLAQMGGLGNVVEAFLGMYKDAVKKSKPENTETPSAGPSTSAATASSAPIKTIDLDGPPMPTAPEDGQTPMQEDGGAAAPACESQKDAKIKMALELLADMGFNNDNQWLTRLLDHFDGDIAKTLDHLTLGK